MTRKKLGAEIKRLRTVRGYTQQQLADKSGLDVQRIPGIELGQSNITLDRLFAVCKALHITINLVPVKTNDFNTL